MKIILGVSGSVAAYRAADLARDFMRLGHSVRVCLTDAAQQFVTPALFEALTGNPCLQNTFDEPERGRMAHIDLAREADVIVVAPATANIINKLAHGYADDMLTTLVLASSAPLIVAPAMNPTMFAAETVQESLLALRNRGATVIEPAVGDVACGENGQGKLASTAEIVNHLVELGSRNRIFEGKRILITNGPTREPIDLVRFVSNRSTGKMGAALARAALQMGASVTVVSGPVQVIYPPQALVVPVQTAHEMLAKSMAQVADYDFIIAVAAVSDYAPTNPSQTKLRRTDESISLELTPNPDIVAELARAANANTKVIGFAAEPSLDLTIAQEKIKRKKLFAIVANDISDPEIGFGSDNNSLTLICRTGNSVTSGKRSKVGCALWLLEQISNLAEC